MKFIGQMEPFLGIEERRAVNRYLKSGGWLTEFKETEHFENMLAGYTGAKHVCVVANGSVSLFIALMALGIGAGDEVIVPNLTMIASANAVLLAGAVPKLVDIDPQNLCLDVSFLEKAITRKTKAIMHVSLNGRSGDMEKLVLFCKKHKLFLIEDAAQSLGSTWNGKHLGTFGQIGSLSFSAPKIITTGQGGALLTNDRVLDKKIRKIKDFGRVKSGVDLHETFGFNFKFTDLQAVIGIEQMKKLPARVKKKKALYAEYQKHLKDIPQITFFETNLTDTTPWFMDVFVENREKLIAYLKEHGVGSRPFYPPVHTQAPYNHMQAHQKAGYTVSEEVSKKCLWLPSSVFLTKVHVYYITRLIKQFYK